MTMQRADTARSAARRHGSRLPAHLTTREHQQRLSICPAEQASAGRSGRREAGRIAGDRQVEHTATETNLCQRPLRPKQAQGMVMAVASRIRDFDHSGFGQRCEPLRRAGNIEHPVGPNGINHELPGIEHQPHLARSSQTVGVNAGSKRAVEQRLARLPTANGMLGPRLKAAQGGSRWLEVARGGSPDGRQRTSAIHTAERQTPPRCAIGIGLGALLADLSSRQA